MIDNSIDLKQLINCYSEINNIPITIYEEDLPKTSFFPPLIKNKDDLFLLNELISYITKDLSNNYKIFIEDKFFTAYIRTNNQYIIVGPVKISTIANNEISDYMKFKKLPKIYYPFISSLIEKIPTMEYLVFAKHIYLLNCLINNNDSSLQNIISENETKKEEIENNEVIKEQVTQHVSSIFEDRIIYCVKNGLTEELLNIDYSTTNGKVGNLGNTSMRSFKNMCIILNSLCLRASIQGGLDRDLACTIGEEYVRKIESCNTVYELKQITQSIKINYSTRVRELKKLNIENKKIIDAITFIDKNIYNDIKQVDVANHLNISKEYFSSLFNKIMKKSFNQYLNEKRISEAKKLLRFSNKSISEIAYALEFSSQSHFQNEFKKITSISPNKYRKETNE